MRTMTLLLAPAIALLLAAPADAKTKKLELVDGPVVEDKAGHDADTELDFERLTLEPTAEHLQLTIETYTAWDEIRAPEEVNVIIKAAKAGSRKFPGWALWIKPGDEGHTVTGGKRVGTDAAKGGWEASGGGVGLTLEGRTLTVTIPWDQLPAEHVWIQVGALSAMEVEDDETGETKTSMKGGSANPVPSDYVPNFWKAVEVRKP